LAGRAIGELMRTGIFGRIGLGGVIGCAAIGAMVLAGCGGGSDTTSAGASGASGASGTALSQDEFVSQANAACKESNDKVAALKAPSATASIQDQIPTLEQDIAIANDTYTQLNAITPPTNLQAKYTAYLNAGKGQIAFANQLLDAAKANDTSKLQQIAPKLNAGKAQADAQAKALGLTECAKDVRPQG
jgi:hypothetical protein